MVVDDIGLARCSNHTLTPLSQPLPSVVDMTQIPRPRTDHGTAIIGGGATRHLPPGSTALLPPLLPSIFAIATHLPLRYQVSSFVGRRGRLDETSQQDKAFETKTREPTNDRTWWGPSGAARVQGTHVVVVECSCCVTQRSSRVDGFCEVLK